MRHHLRFLPLLSLFAATGCERFPEDPVFVYGKALSTEGSPLAGQVLTVERVPFQRFSGKAPTAPAAFSAYGTATVQANGEFTLEFLYGDLEASLEDNFEQYRFRLALPLEDGRGTFLTFSVFEDAELPTLQPWDDHATVSVGPGGPTVSFAPAPPAPELPPSGQLGSTVYSDGGYVDENGNYVPPTEPPRVEILHPTTPEPIVELSSGGETLWRQLGVASPWTPSPYLLEDFAGPEAQLRALTVGLWRFNPLGGNSSTVEFRQEWRTARLPLPAGASRPVSRGASCQPSSQPGCPWTDGLLSPVAFTGDEAPLPAEQPRALTLTLAQPTRLKRAVLRGLRYTHEYTGWEELWCEGSLDGEHWAPLGKVTVRDLDEQESGFRLQNQEFTTATSWDSPFDGKLELYDEAPEFLDVPLETPEPVLHVRFRIETEAPGDVGGVLKSLSEVSLFE